MWLNPDFLLEPGVWPRELYHNSVAGATLFSDYWRYSSKNGWCCGQRVPTTGAHPFAY